MAPPGGRDRGVGGRRINCQIVLVHGHLEIYMFLCYTVTRAHEYTARRSINMAERNLENITVTMSKEEKKALKQAALDNDVSVSELIRKWLAEYWKKDGKNHV